MTLMLTKLHNLKLLGLISILVVGLGFPTYYLSKSTDKIEQTSNVKNLQTASNQKIVREKESRPKMNWQDLRTVQLSNDELIETLQAFCPDFQPSKLCPGACISKAMTSLMTKRAQVSTKSYNQVMDNCLDPETFVASKSGS